MRCFTYKGNTEIPECYLQDCMELQRFIRENLQIDISLLDTYRFWCDVSDSWDAIWLYIDTHYEDETREDFLEYQLQKYGNIYEIEYHLS